MPEQNASPVKAREIALKALVRVEQDEAYLNLAFPPLLKPLPVKERALAVHLAKGSLQRLNTLDWALSLFCRRSIATLTPWIRNLLRLGAYQCLYMDKVPDYALVDQSVRLARRYGHRGVAGLVNAVLRRLVREAKQLPWPDPDQRPLEYISLRHSHPQWMVARALERFGFEEAEKWCRANNDIPVITIRPNGLKISAEELAKDLRTEGFKVKKNLRLPAILEISGAGSPAFTRAFQQGHFTIQGASSSLVAPLCGVRPGDRVIDLCSAPGGKATHLAELTLDRGQVYAVELNQSRLQLVIKAARRLGLKSIKPVLADGRDLNQCDFPDPHAVLVDAPCSGLGVVRRLPEIKWRRREEDLARFQTLQLELLDNAASLLPQGGKLVYAVCTTEPEETSAVVEALNRRGDLELQPIKPYLSSFLQDQPEDLPGKDLKPGPLYLWPHRHGLDGFFMALWIKRDGPV